MRRTVVGVIAVVTASSVFALVGTSTASAATALASAMQPGASAAFSPVVEATAVKNLHDALAAEWKAKDAVALQSTSASLATELTKLRAPQRRAAMAPDAVTTVGKATQQNDEFGQALATIIAAHGKSAHDGLPGLGLLNSVTSLLTSLLSTLLSLITSLLGGLPGVGGGGGLPIGLPPLPIGTPPPPGK